MLTVDFNKLNIKPGDRILDAGCGTGRHLCEAYRDRGIHVVGIDMNWEDLRKAKYTLFSMEHSTGGSWMTSKADVTRLPFKDEAFDVVICSEVLEHIPDNRAAVSELVRVLKAGKNMVVSVPRYLPERICWALSRDYHNEPGGHIRIYKKRQIQSMMEAAGTKCWRINYRHSLHVPYWWLKCMVGHKRENSSIVNGYKAFLEWDIMKKPLFTRMLDKMLNPLIGKSVVLYFKKDVVHGT
ncbi:MAG: class I SAM-dependent methyltransferase [Deltaproteobacteria bacterium]|nr:class I SAM-dependent methyltransferase [Deltaproteobacteria bacterium]